MIQQEYMQNKVHKFLEKLLKESTQFERLDSDNELNGIFNPADYIYAKLTSKKYRKFKMHPECITRTKLAISTRISNNEPIHIVYPQGGYKLWQLPSSPTVDWAEFFNISYLLNYIAPIAASYKPGVQLTYFMHTILMELHDNLTTTEINDYINSFERLLAEFRKYVPENIQISILKDSDLYTRDEYFKSIEEGVSAIEKEYENWTPDRKDKYARMANLNIKWDGKEDWTKLSPKEKDKKIYKAALYEAAATSGLKKISEKVKSSVNVLVFTSSSPAFIGIGTTKSSIAKYWVGLGVLEKRNDSYLPVILSPTQYTESLKKTFQEVSCDLIDLPNFKKILVFSNPLNFYKTNNPKVKVK